MRLVELTIVLLALTGCEASVTDAPDFVGNYSPINPYNTEGEPSYVIRVLEDGRAQYDDVDCYDSSSPTREARWEVRGTQLVFLPVGDEPAIFSAWETDAAFLKEDGCGSMKLSYSAPGGPEGSRDVNVELYRYEPCYARDPAPGNGEEGNSGCIGVRCDDLPDCDFAL